MAVTNVTSQVANTAATSAITSSNDAASADRFLKLLVAQMQNQDPLNPLDNAQVTTQMAQIQTVTGVEKLNTSIQGLQGQFLQMQALQGASLVGRDVIVPGNKMDIDGTAGQGGFELTSAADAVKVEVLNAGGHVVDTLNLGAQAAGMHSFDWDASKSSDANLTFRVTATLGAATISSTALMRDKVTAVTTAGDKLSLELERQGSTPYADVKAFN
jgi:flagellar basal-body rod modification protein FlgD